MRSATTKLYGGDSRRLLPPFLATIQTPDEDCHRLIRRPRLHLPIARLRLLTALARKQRRPLLLGPFQHERLPLHMLIGQRLPVLRVQFPRGHKRHLVRREFPFLEPGQQPAIGHIGRRVEVRDGSSCESLVERRKGRVLPVLPDTLTIGSGQRCIVDTLFQIEPLLFRQVRAQSRLEDRGNSGA